MTVVPLMIALTLSTILGAPRGASVGGLGSRASCCSRHARGVRRCSRSPHAAALSLFPVRRRHGRLAPRRDGGRRPTAAPPLPSPGAAGGSPRSCRRTCSAAARPATSCRSWSSPPSSAWPHRLPPSGATRCGDRPGARGRHAGARRLDPLVLPIGVFALCLAFAFRTGRADRRARRWFALVSPALLLAATLLLYPVTAFLGRAPTGRFARGAAPAQAVAIGTRSSLAALPALVEGGQPHLGLPAGDRPRPPALRQRVQARSRVRASSSSCFSRTSSASGSRRPARGLLADALPPELQHRRHTERRHGAQHPGLPGRRHSHRGRHDAQRDRADHGLFETLLNVTGDMAAATILSRRERRTAGPSGPPATAPAGSVRAPTREHTVPASP